MEENFVKYKKSETFQEFAEKVEIIWKRVLEENFVLSLINSAEIQVKYDMDNQTNSCKLVMESDMEKILEVFFGEIKANFKAKEPSLDIFMEKSTQLEIESLTAKNEQTQKLRDHIKKQTMNQVMYKKWEQNCIRKLDKVSQRIIDSCQKRLNDYYKYEENDAKWRRVVHQSKIKVQDYVRKIADDLIKQREEGKAGKNITLEFSDKEIEDKFEELWNSEKGKFVWKKERVYVPDNVPEIFIREISSRYGNIAKSQKIFSPLMSLQPEFSVVWINFSHVELKGNFISKLRKKDFPSTEQFREDIEELIAHTESEIQEKLIYLYKHEGLMKMRFQPNSNTFHCKTLVKQYLEKAIELLVETHKQLPRCRYFNLTDTFMAIFSYKAAKLALSSFEAAQVSFINYMDMSNKLETEKENIKQIFTLILKKEETLTIAGIQITKILHQALKNAVVKQVITPCKEMVLQLIKQKIHFHGLVFLDIIHKLDYNLSEENSMYVHGYLTRPFEAFRNKISHVLNDCTDIKLNELIKENFDIALREMKEFFETNLQPSEQLPLIEVICRNSFIRSLGIGEADFDGIVMPQDSKDKTSELNISCDGLFESGKKGVKKDVKKRMQDETDIIEKSKTLILEVDRVSTDISWYQEQEIRYKIVNDVFNHLFDCKQMCPFCNAPCDETHSGEVGKDIIHRSHCHRLVGLEHKLENETGKEILRNCNNVVGTKHKFKNEATGFKLHPFKDYKEVNSYYKSWDIDAMTVDDILYWKYIMYYVEINLNRIFRSSRFKLSRGTSIKKWLAQHLPTFMESWILIPISDAEESTNKLFHLDSNEVARNKDGFQHIKFQHVANGNN